nr:RcnB family protein [uncultured Rhodoferax sp.]
MKSTAIVCTIVIASMGFSTLAQAEGRGRHGPDDERWSQQNQGRHDNGRGHDRNDSRDERRDDRHDNRHENHRDGRRDHRWDGHPGYYGARGPDFRRGGYMPHEYRRPIYVVNNYYGHHLPAPRRGHQWVQVGGDYVLIAIATGIIAQIILSQ